MAIELNFITSNKGKVREFKEILGSKIRLNHVAMEYNEIRAEKPEDVAEFSAQILADKLKMPVVIEDSGLFIESLNGFPGTCSSYIHKKIGLRGILKLMEGAKNRKCTYKSAVGYCRPGEKAVVFSGEEHGEIAEETKGNYGFGHDPIFIPNGSEKTYGEMENCEKLKKFRRNALLKLAEYLEKNI